MNIKIIKRGVAMEVFSFGLLYTKRDKGNEEERCEKWDKLEFLAFFGGKASFEEIFGRSSVEGDFKKGKVIDPKDCW